MTQEFDWREPGNRREIFQMFYRFHLQFKAHPGCVYSLLPALAEYYGANDEQRAWLVWLNGNTQNAVTTMLLFEAAPRWQEWQQAVDFWNDNWTSLEWDTDRRYHKGKFAVATEKWVENFAPDAVEMWLSSSEKDEWGTWEYSLSQPYMGRLSAWSMLEYARILLGPGVPDIPGMMLNDKSGSRSHRNGLGLLAGYDSTYWDADTADLLGIVPELESLAEDLLGEQENIYGPHADLSRLTLESTLCTYKSWHKPNRRYPGVYLDMMYDRIRRGEYFFGKRFSILWETRERELPVYLRLEINPNDPGLASAKQNHYRETGEVPVLGRYFRNIGLSQFDIDIDAGAYGPRKDKSWT
jgi:hypothetical protein